MVFALFVGAHKAYDKLDIELVNLDTMKITIIKDVKKYQTYLKRMHEIFDAKDGTPEGDELDLLAIVIEKYEDDHYPIEAPATKLHSSFW